MSDGIDKVNGQDAMAGNIQNGLWWHKKGVQLDGQKTGREILEAVPGGTARIVKQPLFTYGVGDNSTKLLPVGGRVATVRDIDSRVIATVGEKYVVIQQEEVAEFADALIQVDGGVKFESAGILFDGRIFWMLAAVPDKAFHVDGDEGKIMPYIVLKTGHDGLTAFSLQPTPVRVVCANTLNMAFAGNKRAAFTIRHTVRAAERVEAARKALGFATIDYIDNLKTVSQTLVKTKLTLKDITRVTELLIPSTATEPEKAVKAQAQRDSILAIYRNTDNLQNLGDNAYRFVQAVAQWADHDRTYRPTKKGDASDSRALAILDGTAVSYKQKALALVLPEAVARRTKKAVAKVTA